MKHITYFQIFLMNWIILVPNDWAKSVSFLWYWQNRFLFCVFVWIPIKKNYITSMFILLFKNTLVYNRVYDNYKQVLLLKIKYHKAEENIFSPMPCSIRKLKGFFYIYFIWIWSALIFSIFIKFQYLNLRLQYYKTFLICLYFIFKIGCKW